VTLIDSATDPLETSKINCDNTVNPVAHENDTTTQFLDVDIKIMFGITLQKRG